jgi:hypothetical protein
MYTVFGIGASGCPGSATISLFVNPACSDVWPGDANSDGIVSATDVLEIGLAFSNTGALRSPGGNSYVSQYATNWVGTVSSGKNQCHADCNGDGVVNANDTLAIFNNFALSHPFKPSPAAAAGDVWLSIPGNVIYPGVWNKADIMLGDAASPLSQLYGLAYSLTYDNSMIVPDSLNIIYTASFLSAGNQNLTFRKRDFSNGVIHSASVRTNLTDVSGNGKIGELYFKTKGDLAEGASVNFGLSSSVKISGAGVTSNLTTGGTSATVSHNMVGFKDQISKVDFQAYPNPTSGFLEIYTTPDHKQYSVTDISGRLVQTGELQGSGTINMSQLENGTYFISLSSGSSSTIRKIVISK